MKIKESCIRSCADVEMINRCTNKLKELDDKFEATSGVFNLSGNATRLKILYLINAGHKVCVCDLSDILNISVSAISQQLSKLKKGGMLSSHKEGKTIYYSIHDQAKIVLDAMFEIFNSSNSLTAA